MQTDLFNQPPAVIEQPQFKGSDFDEQIDGLRLKTQYDKVFELMKDGAFRTLNDIEISTGILAQASISAHLRYMRKAGHKVEKRRKEGKKGGLFEYKLILKTI